MKNKFINAHREHDFITRSKQSATGFTLINLFYLFYQGGDISTRSTVFFIAIILMIISITRIIISTAYIKKYSWAKINMASNMTVVLAISNGLTWSILNYFVFKGTSDHISGLMITAFITISFSANSLASLGLNRKLLITYNVIILTPLIIFPWFFVIGNPPIDFHYISILATINLIYVYLQSKRLEIDSVQKIQTIYQLSKTLLDLERSKKELENETLKNFHNSRLSTLGEMAAGIAHEINNPLTIVKNYIQFFIKKENEKENLLKLEKALNATTRIEKIVKSMKFITTKNDSDSFESVEISQIIETVLDLTKEKMNQTEIKFVNQNIQSTHLNCNPIQISQVLVNIINNAIDHLSTLSQEFQKQIEIKSFIRDDFYEFQISNSGPPISNELIEKIFNPFFTTKNVGSGTGLGLSISKKIAENHQGELKAEILNGQTTFVLRIPFNSSI